MTRQPQIQSSMNIISKAVKRPRRRGGRGGEGGGGSTWPGLLSARDGLLWTRVKLDNYWTINVYVEFRVYILVYSTCYICEWIVFLLDPTSISVTYSKGKDLRTRYRLYVDLW